MPPRRFLEDLGRAIREKRKRDGLTQTQAAALCGVGVRFLSEVERGKATVTLDKLLLVVNGMGMELSFGMKGVPR